MNLNEIEQLLETYFAGETSLEEERQLSEFFNNTVDIPPHLKAYQPLFQYFQDASTTSLPEIKTEELNDILVEIPKPIKIVKIQSALWRVAATIALIISIWWFFPSSDHTVSAQPIDWSKYEITSEEEALNITLKAYKKVAEELNENTRRAVQEIDELEEITNILN